MALDTGEKITKFQWTELPMPAAVIERVNQIGKNEPSTPTFTNRHGQEIGDTTQNFDPGVDDNTGIEPLADEITGVEQTNDNGESTGVFEPTGVDFNTEPTGVEVEADHSDVQRPVSQEHEEMYQGD
jgi:hypothetical protein